MQTQISATPGSVQDLQLFGLLPLKTGYNWFEPHEIYSGTSGVLGDDDKW